MSNVRDCLFNTFPAPLHIWRQFSIRNLRTPHAVVTGNLLTDAALALTPSLNTFHCFDKYIFSHRHGIRTAARCIAECNLSIHFPFLVHHHLFISSSCSSSSSSSSSYSSCSRSFSHYCCYSSWFMVFRPIFGPWPPRCLGFYAIEFARVKYVVPVPFQIPIITIFSNGYVIFMSFILRLVVSSHVTFQTKRRAIIPITV